MSGAYRHATLRQAADAVSPTAIRIPVDVRGFSDFAIQWVQGSDTGTATATIYGSALPLDDKRLADLDPATNLHWEEDTTVSWTDPGAAGAASARAADNAWSTVLVEIDVTAGTLGDFALYFFGKER